MYTDVGKPHASEDMSDMFVMTGETGSYRYMSPEVFRHESYNIKADCYAFAMIAYQVGKEREREGGADRCQAGGCRYTLVAISFKGARVTREQPGMEKRSAAVGCRCSFSSTHNSTAAR